jgi:hypothetical protein
MGRQRGVSFGHAGRGLPGAKGLRGQEAMKGLVEGAADGVVTPRHLGEGFGAGGVAIGVELAPGCHGGTRLRIAEPEGEARGRNCLRAWKQGGKRRAEVVTAKGCSSLRPGHAPATDHFRTCQAEATFCSHPSRPTRPCRELHNAIQSP